jgi:hypothetical protein
MRSSPTWLIVVGLGLGLGLGGGCDNGKMDLHPEAGPDATPPQPWWRPAPGEATNWDLQVRAPFDLSAERAMYDLDLWALVPAVTTLDYGDGQPVTVPAGALAGAIAELKARANPPVIVCHVATGAIRLTDPDAIKFPGYAAAPPDRPTAPVSGSAIGWSTQDPLEPEERFLDIRAASRTAWESLIWKRLELAQMIGCDGVEADRNDIAMSDPGWAIEPADQTSWYAEVARQAHLRQLSVGMKNGTTLPNQVDALADDFDWMMVERCGEFDDCGVTRPFINLQRAVFAVDYQTTVDGDPQTTSSVCARQRTAQIADGLVKDVAQSSAYRFPCSP